MASVNASNNLIMKTITGLFKRFHLTIFFILIIGSLAVAVVLITETLTKSPDPTEYTSPISAGVIDRATLQKIQALHTSNSQTSLPQLPAGRINAFNE